MRLRFIALVVGVSLLASSVGAQSPTLVRIPFRTYVAVNPLGIPFDIVSAELETGVAQGITVGLAAAYTNLGDDRWTSIDAKFRYYPSEVVLRGFSMGLSVGHTQFSRRTGVSPTGGSEREDLGFPTLGLLVDYNWMLGARRRFIVGTGVGAKRVLASSESRDRVDMDAAYVTARFVVGLAF